MPDEHRETDAFRDAYFERCQLNGVVIRDCDVTNLQIEEVEHRRYAERDLAKLETRN